MTHLAIMEQKVQRVPITARIKFDAQENLLRIVASLLPKAGNTNNASSGKIIETLLLREDALDYVEQQLFPD